MSTTSSTDATTASTTPLDLEMLSVLALIRRYSDVKLSEIPTDHVLQMHALILRELDKKIVENQEDVEKFLYERMAWDMNDDFPALPTVYMSVSEAQDMVGTVEIVRYWDRNPIFRYRLLWQIWDYTRHVLTAIDPPAGKLYLVCVACLHMCYQYLFSYDWETYLVRPKDFGFTPKEINAMMGKIIADTFHSEGCSIMQYFPAHCEELETLVNYERFVY